MEGDLLRVWQLIHELSEQLQHNQTIAGALQSQANILRSQATQASTGVVLRRYNTDISKETFDSELERSNAQLIIENQTLLHENKQLSILLKEYEGTLDTIMAKFRLYAAAASQYELTITRHYEVLLHTRETLSMSSEQTSSANMNASLRRLTHHMRALLHSMSGEDSDSDDPDQDEDNRNDNGSVLTANLNQLSTLIDGLEEKEPSEDSSSEARGDWALERECEISRLEKENEDLRRMLGIDSASIASSGVNTDDIRPDKSKRTSMMIANARRRSTSGSGFSGHGGGGVGESWGIRPPASTPYSMRTGSPANSSQHGLQNPVELQPSGLRYQGRRSAMFGPPPRGGLGLTRSGHTTAMWSHQSLSPASPTPERPWQSQSGTLDLSR